MKKLLIFEESGPFPDLSKVTKGDNFGTFHLIKEGQGVESFLEFMGVDHKSLRKLCQ